MQIGVEVSRSIENKRIFVVHEDEIVRAALQFMLHDENEAHEVPSLEDALEGKGRGAPDLLLVGMGLVWSRGMDVLRDLRRRFPGGRILLVAESEDDPDANACLGGGVVGVIGKPLTIEGVRRKVDLALGRVPSYAGWKASL